MGADNKIPGLRSRAQPLGLAARSRQVQRRFCRRGGCRLRSFSLVRHRRFHPPARRLCGVTGFKPTYGRVSRRGLVAFASLDQIGPLARSSADCALVLQAICGHDPADATCPAGGPDFRACLQADVRGLRLGLPRENFTCCDEEVAGAVEEAARQLELAGATVHWCPCPIGMRW